MNKKTNNLFHQNECLIVSALDFEFQNKINHSKILYTGVGKINATINLTNYLLDKNNQSSPPKLIINLGSAGSHQFNQFELINCIEFFQHDMDVSALGFEKGQTPFDDTPILLKNAIKNPHLKQARLYTGDSFITDSSLNYPVIDMEGYALAKICYNFDINFLCVKVISDGADENAHKWETTMDIVSTKLADFWHNNFINYFTV